MLAEFLRLKCFKRIFILASSLIFIATSLTSMALPRLPADNSKFKAVELSWFRLDAIVTFILHTLCLAMIPLMGQFHLLHTQVEPHKCDRIKTEPEFILTGFGGIICFGISYVLLVEAYCRIWPHLLVKDIHEQSIK